MGRVENACVPQFTAEVKANVGSKYEDFFVTHGGKKFPKEILDNVNDEIEELCNILQHEGVRVRRPEIIDHEKVRETFEIYFLYHYTPLTQHFPNST